MLDVDQELLLVELQNEAIDSYGEGAGLILQELSDFMGFDPVTPLYAVLDTFLNSLVRSDFHLDKNYTVLADIDKSYNKWPRAFGNAIFIDSKYLIETVIEMVYHNAYQVVTRNSESEQTLAQLNKLHTYVLK